MKKNLLLNSILLSIIFCSAACVTQKSATTGLNKKNKAPEIVCTDVNGNILKLSSLKGKLVLLEFWSSTNSTCHKDHLEMEKLYQKYKSSEFKNGKGFTIYSVSVDTNKNAWLKAISDDGISWPNQVNDFGKWNSACVLQYKVNSVPQYYLIDKNGNIINHSFLISDLEKILSKDLVKL